MTEKDRGAYSIADKHFVGKYSHQQPLPKGNLYNAVRRHLGLSVAGACKAFGVGLTAWTYRERSKRLYRIAEIVALQELSGLSNDDFVKMLNDVA